MAEGLENNMETENHLLPLDNDCYQDSTIALFYGGGGNGSWWGWIQSARDKVVNQSSEVFENVIKDIDEFTKVVTEEASSVVSTTASTLKEKLRLDTEESAASNVKKSVSGFLNHVAEVFTPPPDDGDQEAIVIRNQQPVILNRLQAAIYAISQDTATFLTDPEGEEKQYEEWLSTFDLESRQAELSDLLVNNQPLRHNYTALVPAQVSHVVFWHRYFYKVSQLEAADARRQELKQRAEKSSTDAELVWDEDEEFGGDVEITEEMQAQLLEDYQRECEEMGKGSSNKMGNNKQLESSDKSDISKDSVAAKDTESSSTDKILEELKVDLNKTTEVASKPSPSSTEESGSTCPLTPEEMKRLSISVSRITDEQMLDLAVMIKNREPSLKDCNIKDMEVDFEQMKPATVRAIEAFISKLVGDKASPSSVEGTFVPVSSSSSSLDSKSESNEDEWEKVDATDAANSQSSSSTEKSKTEKTEDGKSEDWENWD